MGNKKKRKKHFAVLFLHISISNRALFPASLLCLFVCSHHYEKREKMKRESTTSPLVYVCKCQSSVNNNAILKITNHESRKPRSFKSIASRPNKSSQIAFLLFFFFALPLVRDWPVRDVQKSFRANRCLPSYLHWFIDWNGERPFVFASHSINFYGEQ